jgi:hypothetical protein
MEAYGVEVQFERRFDEAGDLRLERLHPGPRREAQLGDDLVSQESKRAGVLDVRVACKEQLLCDSPDGGVRWT